MKSKKGVSINMLSKQAKEDALEIVFGQLKRQQNVHFRKLKEDDDYHKRVVEGEVTAEMKIMKDLQKQIDDILRR